MQWNQDREVINQVKLVFKEIHWGTKNSIVSLNHIPQRKGKFHSVLSFCSTRINDGVLVVTSRFQMAHMALCHRDSIHPPVLNQSWLRWECLCRAQIAPGNLLSQDVLKEWMEVIISHQLLHTCPKVYRNRERFLRFYLTWQGRDSVNPSRSWNRILQILYEESAGSSLCLHLCW